MADGAQASGAWLNEGADGRYWQALAEGRLELPRCEGCSRWHWPAVWRCGDCGSWEHAWYGVPMTGTVYSWTRTWHPFAGVEALAKPFVSLVVALDGADHRRLTGLLEGDDQPVIGAPVHGFISATVFAGQSIPTIKWRLTEAGR